MGVERAGRVRERVEAPAVARDGRRIARGEARHEHVGPRGEELAVDLVLGPLEFVAERLSALHDRGRVELSVLRAAEAIVGGLHELPAALDDARLQGLVEPCLAHDALARHGLGALVFAPLLWPHGLDVAGAPFLHLGGQDVAVQVGGVLRREAPEEVAEQLLALPSPRVPVHVEQQVGGDRVGRVARGQRAQDVVAHADREGAEALRVDVLRRHVRLRQRTRRRLDHGQGPVEADPGERHELLDALVVERVVGRRWRVAGLEVRRECRSEPPPVNERQRSPPCALRDHLAEVVHVLEAGPEGGGPSIGGVEELPGERAIRVRRDELPHDLAHHLLAVPVGQDHVREPRRVVGAAEDVRPRRLHALLDREPGEEDRQLLHDLRHLGPRRVRRENPCECRTVCLGQDRSEVLQTLQDPAEPVGLRDVLGEVALAVALDRGQDVRQLERPRLVANREVGVQHEARLARLLCLLLLDGLVAGLLVLEEAEPAIFEILPDFLHLLTVELDVHGRSAFLVRNAPFKAGPPSALP